MKVPAGLPYAGLTFEEACADQLFCRQVAKKRSKEPLRQALAEFAKGQIALAKARALCPSSAQPLAAEDLHAPLDPAKLQLVPVRPLPLRRALRQGNQWSSLRWSGWGNLAAFLRRLPKLVWAASPGYLILLALLLLLPQVSGVIMLGMASTIMHNICSLLALLMAGALLEIKAHLQGAWAHKQLLEQQAAAHLASWLGLDWLVPSLFPNVNVNNEAQHHDASRRRRRRSAAGQAQLPSRPVDTPELPPPSPSAFSEYVALAEGCIIGALLLLRCRPAVGGGA